MSDVPIWGRYAPYDDACAVLLARLSTGLPLPHFWSLEENEQKVTEAVLDNTPMTLGVWVTLSPPERVVWVKKATEALAKPPAAPAEVGIPGEWVTQTVAAGRLNVSKTTIKRYIESGKLKSREVPNKTGSGTHPVVFLPESPPGK